MANIYDAAKYREGATEPTGEESDGDAFTAFRPKRHCKIIVLTGCKLLRALGVT